MSFISKCIILLLFIIIIQCMCKHCVLQEGFSLDSIKDKMKEKRDSLKDKMEEKKDFLKDKMEEKEKEIDLKMETENLKQKKIETENDRIETETKKIEMEKERLKNEKEESKNKFMSTLSGLGTGMLEDYAEENDMKIVK